MCGGNHHVAGVVGNGFQHMTKIVQDFGGYLPVDLEVVSRDLQATVLANELRFFTVQAYTSAIHAMWALTVAGDRYVLLAPDAMPPVTLLRAARWRVVMFRRHLVTALAEEVLVCAGLAGQREEVSARWKPAVVLEGPERKSGVVEHMPFRAKPGIVYGESEIGCAPVELELMTRDARSYTHCRENHDHHPAGRSSEEECARLGRHAKITYIPMRRLATQYPVAFLTSRDTPAAIPHPSGIGLIPNQ